MKHEESTLCAQCDVGISMTNERKGEKSRGKKHEDLKMATFPLSGEVCPTLSALEMLDSQEVKARCQQTAERAISGSQGMNYGINPASAHSTLSFILVTSHCLVTMSKTQNVHLGTWEFYTLPCCLLQETCSCKTETV